MRRIGYAAILVILLLAISDIYAWPWMFDLHAGYNTGVFPASLSTSDLNGDFLSDIAVANMGDASVCVFFNTGGGNFVHAANYAVGATPFGIESGDFDNDGDIDLATADFDSNTVTILVNSGGGAFIHHQTIHLGLNPHAITAADFNNDGLLDLAVAIWGANSISILQNDGTGSFSLIHTYGVGTGPIAIKGARMNSDNNMDLVVLNCNSNSVSVLLGTGGGAFGSPNSYIVGTEPHGIAVTDLDGNGTNDVAVAVGVSNTIRLLTNNGTGTLNTGNYFAASDFPFGICSADFNHDNKNDLAITTYNSGLAYVYFNQGNLSFQMVAGAQAGYSVTEIAAADFDQDSDADLAYTIPLFNNLYILLNGFDSITMAFDVSGYVYDIETSQPISGVKVEATREMNYSTYTKNGNFLMGWLEFIPQNFRFTHPLYLDTIVSNIGLIPGDTVNISVGLSRLRYCQINGHVYDSDNGQPIQNVSVKSLVNNREFFTNGYGYYYIDSLPNRPQDLAYSHSLYVDSTVNDIAVIANSTVTQDVYLDPSGWIKGHITDTAGNAIPYVYVGIANPRQTVGSNALGDYVIGDLRTGSYDITFSKLYYDNNTIPGIAVAMRETTICNAILTHWPVQVEIWYGNPDGSPITVSPGNSFAVDVYIKTYPGVAIANLHACLGVNDLYIDSLLCKPLGIMYDPLPLWDDVQFLNPDHAPPNDSGWSSQSFIGFSDIGGTPNPFLISEEPRHILTMVMRAVDNPELIRDTVNCFGPGHSSVLGTSAAGDSVGGPGYPVTEYFSPIVFKEYDPACDYYRGDINGDNQIIGADVTYGVRYLKGIGPAPLDSCYLDSTSSYLYSAADVNGNCEFRGSDITRLVAYFKSTATLSYCHFKPPRM